MSFKILQGGTVITFDNSTQRIVVLPNTSLTIKESVIHSLTPTSSTPIPPNAEIIDVTGKIVSPGFINTHVHTWQSVYRTLGPDIFLAQYFGDWLWHLSPKTAAAFRPDDVYVSCLEGYLEGLNAGVTSFLDHAHHNWGREVVGPGADAAVDSGARVWWCYDVGEREGFPMEEQWEVFGAVAKKMKAGGLVQPGISLDAVMGNFGKDVVEHTKEMIRKLNLKALTVHHLGGPWPSHHGSAPALMCEHKLHNDECPLIFSHGPFLTEEDQLALRENDSFISITPESEMHFGHGSKTGHLISDQASLGIDTNWTFSGDILSQARLWLQTVRLTQYHKTLEGGKLPNANPFSVEQGFLMATRQGGLALKRPDIGVIQVGAKADIVVFNGDSPSMLGWSDAVAAVMLHANTGDIEHVLVDGEFRKRDFKLTNLKWSHVKERFLEAARRIQPLVAEPPPMPEKVFGSGEMGDVEIVSTIRS
ncbi:amidohydrolase family protein [Rutstroemia sp. NJR-2017a WRK4]|nr:amidohydrolase family protein [Rutstroemia sp. NJR-2017a WRK4]